MLHSNIEQNLCAAGSALTTNMWPLLLLLATSVMAHSITDSLESIETDADIVSLEKDPTTSYIRNFKNIMADYVKNQYRYLTPEEMDDIRKTIQEFLRNFASDLRDIIVNGFYQTDGELEDGLPDSTFDELKNSLQKEMDGISETTADHIVYKLRKNLYDTRQKIDQIIKGSEEPIKY